MTLLCSFNKAGGLFDIDLNTGAVPGRKIAFLGVGSALRSDDAAGMYFIELLGKVVKKKNVLLIAGSTAPENFTGVIKDFAPHKLIIVDAAYMGLLPGEARVVPAAGIGGLSFSTHMLPLTTMLKYLHSEIHCEIIFVGVQPGFTGEGMSMSDEVKSGIRRLVDYFHKALDAV